MIKPLESFCVSFLLDNLNAENMFTILQVCIDCETDKRLMERCKEILRTDTKDVLNTESFLKISKECLAFVLEDDFLNIAEIDLFHLVWFGFTLFVFCAYDKSDNKNIETIRCASLI